MTHDTTPKPYKKVQATELPHLQQPLVPAAQLQSSPSNCHLQPTSGTPHCCSSTGLRQSATQVPCQAQQRMQFQVLLCPTVTSTEHLSPPINAPRTAADKMPASKRLCLHGNIANSVTHSSTSAPQTRKLPAESSITRQRCGSTQLHPNHTTPTAIGSNCCCRCCGASANTVTLSQ
jgi:hypothetical protein